MTEKRGMKALEAWCRKVTNGYRDVKINNMTTAWRDGMAFCAIIHHFQPDLIDFDSLCKDNIFQNNDLAFSMAERLGIPALLDAEDMVSYKVPDKLSILTYVSQLYQHFHNLETPSPAKRSLEAVNSDAAEVAESPEKRVALDLPSSASLTTTTSSPRLPRTDVCQACKNRVYILERLIVDNKLYHRTCFKCLKCRAVLSPGSYVECDASDQYECIQCPSSRDDSRLAKKRLGEAVLQRFSMVASKTAVADPPPPRRQSPVSELEHTPKPSAIAAARLRFHDQNLNDVGPQNSSEFLDTGQPVIGQSPTRDENNRSLSRKPKNELNKSLVQELNKFVGGEQDKSLVQESNSFTGGEPNNPNSVGDEQDKSSFQELNKSVGDEPNKSKSVADALNPPFAAAAPSSTTKSDVRSDSPPPPSTVKSIRDICSSSDHPSAPPSTTDNASDAADIRNNNIGTPPSAKLPLPPGSESGGESSDGCAAKPALPQKPVLPERPRFLQIHRLNHVNAPSDPTAPTPDVSPTSKSDVKSTESQKPKLDSGATVSAMSESNVDPTVSPKSKSDIESAESQKPKSDVVRTTSKSDVDPAIKLSLNDSLESDGISIAKVGKQSGSDRPIPVAAPRASRAKRQQVQVPQIQESHITPLPPPKREAVPTRGGGVSPLPPKPPRHTAASEDGRGCAAADQEPKKQLAADPEYPSELNPFGDEEESTEAPAAPTPEKKASLNPFGDSDEEEPEQVVPKAPAPEPVQRRLVPCYVNPFSSDSEDDSEVGSRFSVSPVPSLHGVASPRKAAAPPPPSPNDAVVSARKKRPAPKPPGPAPQYEGSGEESFLTEKSLKELDNMNRTKAGRRGSPPGPGSNPLSPDSLESQSEEWGGGGGGAMVRPSANTFGNWKKKKKRAPPLPGPRRRQIASISIKDIQAELLDIEEKHLELESRGVRIEKCIREKFNDEIDPSIEEEDLILQLFDLVNKKNELFRRQTELTYLKRQQRLEEEHADLEYQIRCLMEKSDDKKTDEDRALEDQLIARLVEVVTQRSEIIESMEMDRVREAEEDLSLQQQLGSSNRGSMSSQGSLGGGGSVAHLSVAPSVSGKSKTKKKDKESKKKKSSHKSKDEDKDTDDTETKKKASKDKKTKKKWF